MKAEFVVQNSDNAMYLGSGTRVIGTAHFALAEGTSLKIGSECLLGSGLIIRTTDSHSIIDNEGKRLNLAEDIEVGNHVWTTHDVQINKGAKIGMNSVIGCGSVVNRGTYKDGAILAGVPARVVKENINWLDERV